MAAEDVKVTFGGSIEGLQAATREAVETVEGMTAPLRELQESFSAIGEAIAGAFAVEKLLSFGEAAEELGDKLHKASEETGMSVEDLSALRVSADHADVGFDTLQRGIGRFVESVQAGIDGTGKQSQAFAALGITQDMLKEKGGDTSGMLELVAQKLDQFGDGANKQAIVMALFGQRLRDIQPVLTDLAQNGMEGLRQKASQVGELFSGEFAEDMKKSHDAVKDFEEEWESLGVALGAHVLPIITALTHEIGLLFKAGGGEQAGLEERIALLNETEAAIKKIEDDGPNASFWDRMFHGGDEQLHALKEQAAQLKKEIEDIKSLTPIVITHDRINDPVKPQAPAMDDGSQQPPDQGGQQAAAQSRLTAWRDELEQKLMAEQNYFSESKSEELAFWQSKLALTTAGSEEQFAVERNIYTLSKALAVQARADSNALAKEDVDNQAALGKIKIQQEKDELDAEVDAHKITAQQKIAILKDLTNQEYQLTLAELQTELSQLADQPVQYQKTYDQILQLKAKLNADMAALDRQNAAAQKQQLDQMTKSWEQALNPIDQAFTSGIKGMVTGTETLKQAVGQLMDGLVGGIIDDIAKMVEHWLAGELAKTAATQTGVAAQIAAWLTGDVAGAADSKAGALSQVDAAGAVTYANAFAATAAIPMVGPELAPGAASAATAAMFGGALPLLSAAGGAWDLPSDMMVSAHARESIIPASIASPMRQYFQNGGAAGGGGGDNYTITLAPQITAMDGQSVLQVIRPVMDTLAKDMMAHIARNPSLRGKF